MRSWSLALALSAVVAGCATEDAGYVQTGHGFLYEGPDKEKLRPQGVAIPLTPIPIFYPRRQYENGVEGCVVASFNILPNGYADNYRILFSLPEGAFDKAALSALNQATFEQPPLPGRYAITVFYQLNDEKPTGCEDIHVETFIENETNKQGETK